MTPPLAFAASATPSIHGAETGKSDAPAAGASVGVARLYALDNAKFILIVLVCVEHLFGPCAGVSVPYVTASTKVFMMPAWVAISGFCSSRDFSRQRAVDGIIKVAAIYFMAQGFWLCLSRYADAWYETTWWGKMLSSQGAHYRDTRWKLEDWLVPYFQLWYLRDLVLWRLALPFWWRLKYPLLTAWVFCAAFPTFKMYGGMFDVGAWYLDVNQTVAWFPLFCVGAVAKQRDLHPSQTLCHRIVGLAVLAAFAWIPWCTSYGMNGEIWRNTGTLDTLNPWTGDAFGGECIKFLIRLLVPVVHAVCVCAFLHIVPHEKVRVLTSSGSRSLACYVFHPLSGMLFSYLGTYGPLRSDWGSSACPTWSEPVLYALVILQSLLWCSPIIWRIVWLVCDPPVHVLLDTQQERPLGKTEAVADASEKGRELNSIVSV